MRLSTRSHPPIMVFRIAGVLAIIVACLVALRVLVTPWGLYELGLSNIDGRPIPLIGDSPTVEDDRRTQQAVVSI